jgi:hypothetical protein
MSNLEKSQIANLLAAGKSQITNNKSQITNLLAAGKSQITSPK